MDRSGRSVTTWRITTDRSGRPVTTWRITTDRSGRPVTTWRITTDRSGRPVTTWRVACSGPGKRLVLTKSIHDRSLTYPWGRSMAVEPVSARCSGHLVARTESRADSRALPRTKGRQGSGHRPRHATYGLAFACSLLGLPLPPLAGACRKLEAIKGRTYALLHLAATKAGPTSPGSGPEPCPERLRASSRFLFRAGATRPWTRRNLRDKACIRP